jgi:hypothetical protein
VRLRPIRAISSRLGGRLAVATTIVSAMTLSLALLSSGTAQASSTRCGYELNGDQNVNTCMSVTGSGLKVDDTTAFATVLDAGRTLAIGIVYISPGCSLSCGYKTIVASNFIYVAPKGSIATYWNPNRNEAQGNYCAAVWRSSFATLIALECVDVHS